MEQPEKYLLQYIVKNRRKIHPTWQDVNELNLAKEKMLEEIFESGDGDDYFEKALKKIKHSRERVGVMVSFVHPEYPEIMAIGYSLCNSSIIAGDRFDEIAVERHLLYKKSKGFGLNIAINRAIDWSVPELLPSKSCQVPPSIKVQFRNFADRSKRYYKDRQLPPWVYAAIF